MRWDAIGLTSVREIIKSLIPMRLQVTDVKRTNAGISARETGVQNSCKKCSFWKCTLTSSTQIVCCCFIFQRCFIYSAPNTHYGNTNIYGVGLLSITNTFASVWRKINIFFKSNGYKIRSIVTNVVRMVSI